MNRKYILVTAAALIAAGGFLLARLKSGTDDFTSQPTTKDTGSNTLRQSTEQADVLVNKPTDPKRHDGNGSPGIGDGPATPDVGAMGNPPARLTPPIPNQRFTDFTPEQRVEFARKGHGPGG